MTKWLAIGALVIIVGGVAAFFLYGPAVSIPISKPSPDVPPGTAVEFLTLPPGFQATYYARNVPDARDMALDPSGVLVVSQPEEGKITALVDRGDKSVDEVVTIASGLNRPHGVVFHCASQGECKLYVAETDALRVFDYDELTHQASNGKKILDLPSGGGHSTRSLLFLPAPKNSTLLISVGSSCNVCSENDERRAAILSYDVSSGESGVYAKGLRNAVFMAVNPVNNLVFATEMGRDLLGDDIPPDEINIIKEGGNYGWPTCYGKNIHDTAYDKNTYIRNPCMEPFETESHADLPAHSAPLGLAFIPEDGWPELRNDLLVAYHGSWNRSVPTGYKVVAFDINGRGELAPRDFITGWLAPDGTKYGRPVDILVEPGGSIYISDDHLGAIYRISRL